MMSGEVVGDYGNGNDGNEGNENHDHRKLMKAALMDEIPPRCPRCDSSATKFCYYNNYSTAQPRYFCKTCKRYWTQGGTLRKVPIGGGCRKGKRPKTTLSAAGQNSRPSSSISLSSSSSSSTFSRANQQRSFTIAPQTHMHTTSSSIGSYYPTGGYLPSLATIHALNNPPPRSFTQAVNNGLRGLGFGAGSTNLCILQGFNNANANAPNSLQDEPGIGRVHQRPEEENLRIQTTVAAASRSTNHQNWHLNYINNAANNITNVDDATVWSTVSVMGNSNGGTTSAASGSSNSMNPPNPWAHNLPGYGAPP